MHADQHNRRDLRAEAKPATDSPAPSLVDSDWMDRPAAFLGAANLSPEAAESFVRGVSNPPPWISGIARSFMPSAVAAWAASEMPEGTLAELLTLCRERGTYPAEGAETVEARAYALAVFGPVAVACPGTYPRLGASIRAVFLDMAVRHPWLAQEAQRIVESCHREREERKRATATGAGGEQGRREREAAWQRWLDGGGLARIEGWTPEGCQGLEVPEGAVVLARVSVGWTGLGPTPEDAHRDLAAFTLRMMRDPERAVMDGETPERILAELHEGLSFAVISGDPGLLDLVVQKLTREVPDPDPDPFNFGNR